MFDEIAELYDTSSSRMNVMRCHVWVNESRACDMRGQFSTPPTRTTMEEFLSTGPYLYKGAGLSLHRGLTPYNALLVGYGVIGDNVSIGLSLLVRWGPPQGMRPS